MVHQRHQQAGLSEADGRRHIRPGVGTVRRPAACVRLGAVHGTLWRGSVSDRRLWVGHLLLGVRREL